LQLVADVAEVGRVRRLRPEREVLHLSLQVARAEVAVELGRRARILVAHDPLNRCEVGAAHQQQRGRRVPPVMEANLPHLPDGEELEGALRAPTLS
jgi:hypothetical protein